MENILLELDTAFPLEFDFYHLGHIELRPIEFNEMDPSAVGFRIFGDLSATVVILFEKGLDLSVYSEFGNLLVSKMTHHLNSEKGLDVHISPPFQFNSSRLGQLLQGQKTSVLRKTYVHLYKNSVIPIETLILPGDVEEFGYA